MTRGAPDMDDSRSMVRWPYHWEITGEGGLAVFLVVPDDGQAECSVSRLTLDCDEVLVNGRETEERLFPGSRTYQGPSDEHDAASVPLLACVCLGSTGGAYRSDQGYFQARRTDLTASGLYVYNALKMLYGREPELLTFLDT